MVLNYYVDIVSDGTNAWISPTQNYGSNEYFECTNRLDCLNEMKGQFQVIKDMGFNSIRLVGGYQLEEFNNANLGHRLSSLSNPSSIVNLNFSYSSILACIDDVLNIATEIDLKVILVMGKGNVDTINHINEYAAYLDLIARHLKFNPTLLAYDLRNEPLYESAMTGNKSQMCALVTSWISSMKTIDPNHLITIGYMGVNEVLKWDPELIPTDFASFHVYPDFLDGNKPEKFLNEIYWYKMNYSKPWIIGETGAFGRTSNPNAPSNWATYAAQSSFADLALKGCINCGGKGFSWWMYQDVVGWYGNNNDYIGLLKNSGNISTSINGTPINVLGSYKPAVNLFQNFATYSPTNICEQPANYYSNVYPYKRKYVGSIKNNTTGLPIANARVVAMREHIVGTETNYDILGETFSKSNGTFEITTDQDVEINRISFGYLKTEAKYTPVTSSISITNVTNQTINVGQEQRVNNTESVNVANLTVQGNGTTGGTMNIYAEKRVVFTSTKIEKGGLLRVNSAKDLGELKLNQLYSCSILGKTNTSGTLNTSIENYVSLNNKVTQNDNSILIFPNPTSNIINIHSNTGAIREISIYNSIGDKVFDRKCGGELSKIIDLSEFNSGVYFVKVTLADGMCELNRVTLLK